MPRKEVPSILSSHRKFANYLLLSMILVPLIATVFASAAKAKNKKPLATANIHYSNNEDNLKVQVEGQHFAMEPQDQTAVVGSRVTLPCRVMEKVGALQWTKDDFGLGQHRNLSGFERYSMVGSDEEGDFSLDIFPVMLDDDARYQCQVGPGPQGEAGIRSRFAKLTVLVPPESPKILQGEHLVATEDREIELECVSVGGKPAAEITWIDGLGNVLSKGIEYVKEQLADTRRITAKSILKLTPKKEHHNTTFTCQAQNTADRTYRSAKVILEVKYAPKVMVTVIGGAVTGSGRILEGSEVVMSCEADANPPVQTYSWFINEERVTGDYTTQMVIHNVTRQLHEAAVKCEAVNAVNKSAYIKTLDISYGPVFRQRPVSVEADLGATVTLRCDVDGNPTPDIEWINENSDVVVGTAANLTLKVSSESAGRYYCKAMISGFPEIGAEATVYVKRAPIITSHKVQFGAVGNRAKIDCLAFSIPKADRILWSYEGKIINMTSADPDLYIFEEHHLPEGVRAALVIKESHSNHFGKYNCTVINSYGSDSLLITLIPEPAGSVPVLLVVMGSMSSVAIIIMVVMLAIVYLKRGRKKPIPADVIPEASRGPDKLSDLKHEMRAKAYEADYNADTGSDRLAINLTHSPMPDVQIKSTNLGVPPMTTSVKREDRYSGEFGDHYTRSCNIKRMKGLDFKETANGYAPYFEYAMDYGPPVTEEKNNVNLTSTVNSNAVNSSTLPHYTNPLNPMNVSSNTSLPRTRNDPQQQVVGISNNNGFLGQSLLQNGIDSRFGAMYGNPYLRTGSSALPPLPPPSTANPAATPAPPPYHAPRNHGAHAAVLKNFSSVSSGGILSCGGNGNSVNGGPISVSVSGSSSNLTSSSNTLPATPLAPPPPPPTAITPTNVALTTSSIATATTAATVTAAVIAASQHPSGQFILPPSNGNVAKKGALATHV